MDTTRAYLEKVKKEFEDGDYRPKHINVKLWQDIRLRGAHDFGTAINHFDHSLRY